MKVLDKKSDLMKEIEDKYCGKYGVPNLEHLLRYLFIEEEMNRYQIADVLGISSITVQRWINKIDLTGIRIHFD